MKFGYTILYVDDAEASLTFFEKAFGMSRRFYHESGYGEVETGATALGFASHALGASNLPAGYVSASASNLPLGMEIALVCDDVQNAFDTAIIAGAKPLKAPMAKPGGQIVAYVQCPDGLLVELCTPVQV
jgi:lactoylglutathione lyase